MFKLCQFDKSICWFLFEVNHAYPYIVRPCNVRLSQYVPGWVVRLLICFILSYWFKPAVRLMPLVYWRWNIAIRACMCMARVVVITVCMILHWPGIHHKLSSLKAGTNDLWEEKWSGKKINLLFVVNMRDRLERLLFQICLYKVVIGFLIGYEYVNSGNCYKVCR